MRMGWQATSLIACLLLVGLLGACDAADGVAPGPGAGQPSIVTPTAPTSRPPPTQPAPVRSTWPVATGGAAGPSPGGPPRQTTATLGRPFGLKVGDAATLTDTDLRIEVRGISEDSRCPVNVTCVWVGRAAVALVLTRGGQPGEVKTLATIHGPEKTDRLTYGGYEVRLTAVNPRPASPEQPVRREDYLIELLVVR